MVSEPFIPAATAQKLAEPAIEGTRHEQAKKIALSLIGNKFSPQAVFQTLRDKYPQDVTDAELEKIVKWAVGKNPTPSGYGQTQPFIRPTIQPPAAPKRTPLEHAEWWLSGKTLDVEQFKALSQLPIPADNKAACCLALEMLYQGDENLNIVCAYTMDGMKANPKGQGRIISRDKWLDYVREHGVPSSKAGAWFRINPCVAQGTGTGGAVCDSDVTAFRYLLLESDVLPLGVQLALYSKLKLPIAAVVSSGGKSAHAWVRLDCKDGKEFSETTRRLLGHLQAFGIDQANKNPSRLSRLPGSVREIQAVGDGVQSLLWLNPAKQAATPADLKAFETSLEIPAIDDKPFKATIRESIERYSSLMENRGKLGVPTGFAEFDKDSGGLMPGQMSVIAGETNGGKSSVAINIVNHAVLNNHGVALFTLEMGREEIADLLFAINARVDRNHFNTAEFTNGEVDKMTVQADRLSKVPLWVFDESVMTASQIRKSILALKAENRINLAVIDYAQIVMPEAGDNREQQVAAVARTLCATAKDAKIALVVLSQLNDEGKLRESRVIAHEAHNVFVLENREQEGLMIFKVVKGRRIQKKDYTLKYEPIYCRITDHPKIQPEDMPRYGANDD